MSAIQPVKIISEIRTIGCSFNLTESLWVSSTDMIVKTSEEISLIPGCCRIKFYLSWGYLYNGKRDVSIRQNRLSVKLDQSEEYAKSEQDHLSEFHKVRKITCYILRNGQPVEQKRCSISGVEYGFSYTDLPKDGKLEFRVDLELPFEHPDDMSVHLGNLLDTEDLSDFTIKINDTSFRVHKLILAMRSPKFRGMFSVDMKESRENILDLDHVDAAIMRKFLVYIYTNELELDDEPKKAFHEAMDLFKIADEHQVLCLKSICGRKMAEKCLASFPIEIDRPKHIFELLNFANINDIIDLKVAVSEFMRSSWDAITACPDIWQELMSLPPEQGQNLLQALPVAPKPTR